MLQLQDYSVDKPIKLFDGKFDSDHILQMIVVVR